MKLFQDQYVKNLPDCYQKSQSSNNFKILQLAKGSTDAFRQTLEQINESLNLESATGATLDLYGEMVGQSRGQTNDEQYRMLIKTRIMRNLSNGSYKSIINSLATILNCKPSEISMTDTPNKPCSITLSNINLLTVQQADLSTAQFESLFKTLLPVGIVFEPFAYDGTFEFANSEDVYDEETGFCDVEGGTIGGYLGILSGDTTIVLPI